MQTAVHIAAIRFGLGFRLGETISADPRAWLAAQIRPLPEAPGPSLAACLASARAQRASGFAPGAIPPEGVQRPGDILREEALNWARRLLTTDLPFAERWAEFWSNHFTVSRRRGQATALIGAFQRQAIRPHVFGRLEDMVLSVARHPAMMLYLDNGGSTGPNSPAGQRGRRGLNENFSRELLELHTLGVRTGYSQTDVTELARILTGWSVGRGGESNEPDGFMFRPLAHEPGTKVVLGRDFPEGEEGGIAVIRYLATHPRTSAHLATKLVRHFVADQPPAPAVERVAAVLTETGGDLAAAARAIIALPAAWDAGLAKLRSPQDYCLAVLRGLGAREEAAPSLLGAMASLAQPLWTASGPNGWPDTAADWASPEQLMRRLDWVNQLAGRAAAAGAPDARDVAASTLGPLLKAETIDAVRRASSAREALILLLACPEFQRR